MSTEESLPPNYRKLDVALRSIGYSFEVAVADLIDNSIDARAKNVLVRLINTSAGHLDLAIWDDGVGMSKKTLKEAMRFGADVSQELKRLGKFGLGLKLASLSQAREVRVVSTKGAEISGRAWLEHGIAAGFSCTIFDTSECRQILKDVVPDRAAKPSATVVWWSRLYRVGQHHANPEEHAQKLMRRLVNHLSLAFHRFLSGRPRKINIMLDIFDQDSGKAGIPIGLDPLDPFEYDQSGQKAFPAVMSLDGSYRDRIALKAHIWPPNSGAPQYKLPGGANSRQGFYFYRNHRLIQGGGWNGIRETEPHSSLARLEVDIASDFDIDVSLDVKKVEIQLPPDLVASIQKAKTSSGLDFKKYLKIADETYRTRTMMEAELPLIPSLGLPADLAEFLHRELRIKATAKHRDLKIVWRQLDKQSFFEINRDTGQLKTLIADEADDRASACLDALTTKNWGLDAVEKLVSAGAVPPATQDTSVLTRAAALDAGDPAQVAAAVSALRAADQKLKAVAGSDADGARQVAALLEAALAFHAGHGDGDCPVCGSKKGLTSKWAKESRAEIGQLKIAASASDDAHRGAEAARRKAIELLPAPPKLLAQLFEIGVDGLADARAQWDKWHAGSSIKDLAELAGHLEKQHEAFFDAIDVLKAAAAAELKRREDRWRPIAIALAGTGGSEDPPLRAGWIGMARKARAQAEDIPRIKEAEKWLKDASSDIRNQRFAPIADKAMATWEHLRQQSNVTLGKIELVGTGTKRKVSLDVTVDGVAGAALGVMSQGELHSLALSLFLPRATLPESPFRFVVIDDPVQSMDPARVDGLARALEETALTRQVIVFTHDERLSEAVRRLGIKSQILSVTRRSKSVVEVRTSLDPVKANLEDAQALFHTSDLPGPVLRRIVPGYCRAALEAAFITVVRRRLLAAGRPHGEVDDVLAKGNKLTPLAALALFDDQGRGGEVMGRLNKYGGWAGDAFKQCNEGTHKEYAGDLQQLIRDTEKLTERVAALT